MNLIEEIIFKVDVGDSVESREFSSCFEACLGFVCQVRIYLGGLGEVKPN